MMAYLLLLLYLYHVNSQSLMEGPDNIGTEFYVAFLENLAIPQENNLELYITSATHYPATFQISSPLMPGLFEASGVVEPGQVEVFYGSVLLRTYLSGVEDKGIYVTSDRPISLYGANKEEFTMDAFTAFPSDILHTYYMAVTYNFASSIVIVGTEDDTSVNVTLNTDGCSQFFSMTGFIDYHNDESILYTGGDVITDTINRFQTMSVTASPNGTIDFNVDLTGTIIQSDKPVAIYYGNVRTPVQDNGPTASSDHLVEMLLPPSTWGRFFPLTPTPNRLVGDLFRLISGGDNNVINIGGVDTHTLQYGDCVELDRPSNQFDLLETSEATLVVIFSKTHETFGQMDNPDGGDPFMSTVMPIPQFASSYIIATINPPIGFEFIDTISVVIRDEGDIADLTVDGERIGDMTPPITWQSLGISSNGWEFAFMAIEVQNGQHELFHPNPLKTFLVMESGLTQFTSYGVIAGARAADINTECFNTTSLPGDIIDNDCDGYVDEEADNGIDDDGDGLIDEDLAPPPRIDGEWGPWSGWGECIDDDVFECPVRRRNRTCDNPAPAWGGYPCPGPEEEWEVCEFCGYVKLINGSRPSEGRVYFYNNESTHWGTICAQEFVNDTWPLVVCTELGFPGVQDVSLAIDSYVGTGDDREDITFHHPNCTTSDVTMTYQCGNLVADLGECTHEEDIFLRCEAIPTTVNPTTIVTTDVITTAVTTKLPTENPTENPTEELTTNPMTTTQEVTEAETSRSPTSISHTTGVSTVMPPTTDVPDTTVADEPTTLEETTEGVTSPTIPETSPTTTTEPPTTVPVTQGPGIGIPMTAVCIEGDEKLTWIDTSGAKRTLYCEPVSCSNCAVCIVLGVLASLLWVLLLGISFFVFYYRKKKSEGSRSSSQVGILEDDANS